MPDLARELHEVPSTQQPRGEEWRFDSTTCQKPVRKPRFDNRGQHSAPAPVGIAGQRKAGRVCISVEKCPR